MTASEVEGVPSLLLAKRSGRWSALLRCGWQRIGFGAKRLELLRTPSSMLLSADGAGVLRDRCNPRRSSALVVLLRASTFGAEQWRGQRLEASFGRGRRGRGALEPLGLSEPLALLSKLGSELGLLAIFLGLQLSQGFALGLLGGSPDLGLLPAMLDVPASLLGFERALGMKQRGRLRPALSRAVMARRWAPAEAAELRHAAGLVGAVVDRARRRAELASVERVRRAEDTVALPLGEGEETPGAPGSAAGRGENLSLIEDAEDRLT